MNKPKAVIILSGGMDSTILAYEMAQHYDLHGLSFDYGQKQRIELDKAGTTCRKIKIPHTIMDLQGLGTISSATCANISGSRIDTPDVEQILGDPQPVTYVPNRNMIMLSIACALAETINATKVFIGIQLHDLYGYWDTTQKFVDAMNNVIIQNRTPNGIKIQAPYANLSKIDELYVAARLNVPLEDTWTCYNPIEVGLLLTHPPKPLYYACGKCGSCAERLKAFKTVGMKDPIDYV